MRAATSVLERSMVGSTNSFHSLTSWRADFETRGPDAGGVWGNVFAPLKIGAELVVLWSTY